MIDYTCPKCGEGMSSPLTMAGQPETCPTCGNVAAVPDPPVIQLLTDPLPPRAPLPPPPTPAAQQIIVKPKEGLFLQTMNVGCGVVICIIVAIIVLAILGSSASCPKSSTAVTQEAKLRKVLGPIIEMPEVAWIEFERNNVYIGFREVPADLHPLLRAWALQGNRAIGFGCHIWAAKAEPVGWRPGDGPYYAEVTARYGKIED